VPRIRIPQTGTTIDWPPADAGRIRINARLHLSGPPLEPGIGMELSFKRTPFRRLFKRSDYWCRLRSYAQREVQKTQPLTSAEQKELDRFRPQLLNGSIEQLPPDDLLRRWGSHIACTLHDSMTRPHNPQFTFYTVPTFKVRSRKPLQLIEGSFQGIEYRLGLNRDNLRLLHTVIATEPGASRLLFAVQWYLLPTILIEWALRGRPRGRNAKTQFLMAVIPAAVLAAVELVVKAKTDQRLQARILEALQDDKFSAIVLQGALAADEAGAIGQAALRPVAMALANRTLRPALLRLDIEPLYGSDIANVLDPATRAPLAQFFKAMPEWLTWWFELLLGPEGQAARVLKLI
jgi:hypothetical protein